MKNYSIILFPFSKIPKNYPYWESMLRILKEELPSLKIIQISKTPADLIYNSDTLLLDLPLKEIIKQVETCDLWISVDNFAQHLLSGIKKGVVIWGKSDPDIFGYKDNINLLKDRKYLRRDQFEFWDKEEINIDCWLEPDIISSIILDCLKGEK